MFPSHDPGGADSTSASDSLINIVGNDTTPIFVNYFIINRSASEKLVIGHSAFQGTSGAGTAPQRAEGVGKWANTSSQITEIDIVNTSADSDYGTGTIMKVWGAD